MKVESRIFEIVTAFFFLCGIVYAVLAKESVGVAGLFLTGGLSLIIGTYFRFVSRRLEERPEDNPEAEVSDGAGDVGFFSPGSYWPVTLAASAALVGISLAFFYIWALVIAGILLLISVGGLVFEYHLRPTDH
jgi:Cytochrome c oxidase subunit IV